MNLLYSNVLGNVYLDLTLLIAIIIFLIPLNHKKYFIARIILVTVIWSANSVVISLFYPTNIRGTLINIIIYLSMTIGFFGFCTKASAFSILYGSIWAIITQQSSIEIWLLIHYIYPLKGNYYWFESIIVLTICYTLIGVTIARIIPENGYYKIGPRQLFSGLLLLAVFELLFLLLFSKKDIFNQNINWGAILMAQFYCVTVLYLQSELFKKSAMKQELAILNHLQEQQKTQYKLSKENIALINLKCHDLKHQMKAIKKIVGTEERNKYLEEVRKSVAIYDSIVRTGNEVLDTVLTEKSLYCEANEIKISCVADGSHMDFMDPIDLYAIFGNALDNAIESVSKINNIDERMLDVIVCVEQQFLVIHVINPLEENLQFEEGLPISTKNNKGEHGFGLKSIRHTVKKYDGVLNVKVKDGCFELKILIPIAR